ncbi:OPT oligopeptide transporter [Laetiporus sulphureus 93-53]|uniref:OPT oligopeptide transporter n=1 Tax=Laetiporus sulphureus 93-53 TaxID=1314785 RepID=A0A165E5R5_9APHY|nr:OPT oligopeptide transporter [Laetiporus sulphureus 93-53]KZT06289.1 OPT oligopeptide transporter [Laetiporus sulphureus 93-53]
MEAKSSSFSLPFPQMLRQRNPVPDVPEDVGYIKLHLNDPNWDLNQASPTASVGSVELNDKIERTSSSGYSFRSTELDTESQDDSTYKDSTYKTTSSSSRAHLREADIEEFNDESPYAEVRAAVSNIDDPLMPVNTFRMWFLGIVLSFILAGLNHFFEERYPSLAISALVVQLIALPLGKFLEWLLPTKRFNTFGYVWSLNPGPFNIKEHTVITIMASAVYSDVYVTTVFATQKAFFNQSLTFAYQILLALSTQLLGYSFAGMTRQFLVWPASMIWPGALVSCALLNTLHKNFGKKEKRHMSRERFFLYVFIASTVWYFFPGYIFTALSVFNWVCWIAPKNPTVNALFGYSTGLGMGFLTFDWSMISWIGSPLVTPWWAEANIAVGFVFFFWFLAPILYFKNIFFAKYMPISAAGAYDNTGASYNISEIITNGVFDEVKYRAYSPMFLPTTFSLAYGIQFAAISAVFVHTFLWYRHDIARQLRRALTDERDVHARLMMVYADVPWWWYASLGVISFILGVIGIEVFGTGLPVWSFVISILIAVVFIIPVGMIRAITNQLLPLNVIMEVLVGYMVPGKPVAMMLFKTYGFITVTQSLSLASDMKIGHYMKIPPRTLFVAQTLATVITCFVCVGVQIWQFANIPDFCQADQKDYFTCPDVDTFATASIIWGGIGPQRLFSPGQIYNPMLWFFLIGAFAPIPFYLLARRYPYSIWRYVNTPVLFAGLGQMPPASGINYSSWVMVGAFFQWFMRRFHFRWWMRYNYILSAALDSGVALTLILIFWCLQYPKGGVSINWWGNTVWQNTYDTLGMPFLTTNTSFGPLTWS